MCPLLGNVGRVNPVLGVNQPCLSCNAGVYGGSTCRHMLVDCLSLTVAVALCVPLLPGLCVCRFCAKGSLYGLLHSPGCYLSWVQVVAMLLDAARGMEHLHANSVLHRWVRVGTWVGGWMGRHAAQTV